MTDPEAVGCSLIVQPEGKGPQVLGSYLALLLSYQYGMQVMLAPDLAAAATLMVKHGPQITCVFVVEGRKSISPQLLAALGRKGGIPLFVIMPTGLLTSMAPRLEPLQNVHVCAWERAFGGDDESLRRRVHAAFDASGITRLVEADSEEPYEAVQARVAWRLKQLTTLPTLPEFILRVIRLINDPKTTTEQLEQVLCQDPSMVMKLLQVARSPAFGATGRTAKWSLADIIVRLGLRKVGSLAAQIRMINSFVCPADSTFDMRRFWEHSVGTAMVADRLYTQKRVRLEGPLEFSDYWVASLLHDLGKLVTGTFFPSWYDRIVEQANAFKKGFAAAEARMGEDLQHAHIGRVLLLHRDMGVDLVDTVGGHHTLQEPLSDLLCLVHVANNLAKEVGKGYLPDEEPLYNQNVLRRLRLSRREVRELSKDLGDDLSASIAQMVDQCS